MINPSVSSNSCDKIINLHIISHSLTSSSVRSNNNVHTIYQPTRHSLDFLVDDCRLLPGYSASAAAVLRKDHLSDLQRRVHYGI